MNIKPIHINITVKQIFFILLGTLIYGTGANLFIIPQQMISGGVTGISMLLNYIFSIPVSLSILIINIPIFLISYKVIEKRFTILSLVGMLGLSGSMQLMHFVSKIPFFHINDIFLSSIFGGICSGVGLGLILDYGASTGGSDILSILIKKKTNINIGNAMFILNAFILSIGSIHGGFYVGLYSIFMVLISAIVVNYMVKGFNRKKMMLIVTDKENEVANVILNTFHRGATFLHGEGCYTHANKQIVYCIVKNQEFIDVRDTILAIDPNAFISVLDVSSIQGKGFINAVAE